MYLDLEEVGGLVLAFGQIEVDEVDVDALLEEAGEDSGDGGGQGRTEHGHARHLFSPSAAHWTGERSEERLNSNLLSIFSSEYCKI